MATVGVDITGWRSRRINCCCNRFCFSLRDVRGVSDISGCDCDIDRDIIDHNNSRIDDISDDWSRNYNYIPLFLNRVVDDIVHFDEDLNDLGFEEIPILIGANVFDIAADIVVDPLGIIDGTIAFFVVSRLRTVSRCRVY